eukprot:TRINITY_DN4366_c0_g1_i1.p2 TRINITY_DN4366_c0_g1~~TRINITY_DN4366_c0_g1_i1.p2  ORF type:complete len:582 (-),score=169.17 TRINITY_DN4366_c0_g1_i1:1969-3531(-)
MESAPSGKRKEEGDERRDTTLLSSSLSSLSPSSLNRARGKRSGTSSSFLMEDVHNESDWVSDVEWAVRCQSKGRSAHPQTQTEKEWISYGMKSLRTARDSVNYELLEIICCLLARHQEASLFRKLAEDGIDNESQSIAKKHEEFVPSDHIGASFPEFETVWKDSTRTIAAIDPILTFVAYLIHEELHKSLLEILSLMSMEISSLHIQADWRHGLDTFWRRVGHLKGISMSRTLEYITQHPLATYGENDLELEDETTDDQSICENYLSFVIQESFSNYLDDLGFVRSSGIDESCWFVPKTFSKPDLLKFIEFHHTVMMKNPLNISKSSRVGELMDRYWRSTTQSPALSLFSAHGDQHCSSDMIEAAGQQHFVQESVSSSSPIVLHGMVSLQPNDTTTTTTFPACTGFHEMGSVASSKPIPREISRHSGETISIKLSSFADSVVSMHRLHKPDKPPLSRRVVMATLRTTIRDVLSDDAVKTIILDESIRRINENYHSTKSLYTKAPYDGFPSRQESCTKEDE